MATENLQEVGEVAPEAPEAPAPAIPPEPVEPPRSRFLFVDVAAMRAKQLRRGALPRLPEGTHMPLKAERIAMEEVRSGLVSYDLPEFKGRTAAEL